MPHLLDRELIVHHAFAALECNNVNLYDQAWISAVMANVVFFYSTYSFSDCFHLLIICHII